MCVSLFYVNDTGSIGSRGPRRGKAVRVGSSMQNKRRPGGGEGAPLGAEALQVRLVLRYIKCRFFSILNPSEGKAHTHHWQSPKGSPKGRTINVNTMLREAPANDPYVFWHFKIAQNVPGTFIPTAVGMNFQRQIDNSPGSQRRSETPHYYPKCIKRTSSLLRREGALKLMASFSWGAERRFFLFFLSGC